MNTLNHKIIEDALSAINETDYNIVEAGGNGIMITRDSRPPDQGAVAFGYLEIEEAAIENGVTTWIMDSFFVTFKENNMVSVDAANGLININLADPNSFQQLGEALRAGFKSIDAYYERRPEVNGSDQQLAS